MTENLSETIRRQFAAQRALYAEMVYDLLRANEISDDLHYNNLHMIIVDEVQIYFAETGVEITFDDVYGDDLEADSTAFLTIAAPYTPTAVATLVQGLLKTLHYPSPFFSPTPEYPWCCGRPMHEHHAHVWNLPGGVADVERVLHCVVCDGYTRVKVTDADEANCLASEVTRS